MLPLTYYIVQAMEQVAKFVTVIDSGVILHLDSGSGDDLLIS